MECSDLSPSVGEELVAADRAVGDLVDVLGRLSLAKDLGAAPVFEFA